jgi:hypothetical protein
MRRRAGPSRWLGENVLRGRGEFQSAHLDFERGIRVGHLEPGERLTQIFKRRLAERHGAPMICDRWGRGVHWQWICWVPAPNRDAKPRSSGHNFGSAKFFAAIDREERRFQAGMQVERGPIGRAAAGGAVALADDWDWHVLLRALRGAELPRLLGRLVRDGFRIRAGAFDELVEYDRRTWDAAACRRRAARFAADSWGGFQLFWPMAEAEVRATPGPEIVEAVAAVFDEVAPAMNLCMYAPCLRSGPGASVRERASRR